MHTSRASEAGEPDGPIRFETAAAQATRYVPLVQPTARVRDIREMLAARRYESASHVVVCKGDHFVGVATIEDVLCAPAEASIESLMDRGAPVVAPGVDQEVAAWQAVRHGESALAVVDHGGRFVGVIPPQRLVAVLLAEHEEDLSRLTGFLRSSNTARTASEEPARRRF